MREKGFRQPSKEKSTEAPEKKLNLITYLLFTPLIYPPLHILDIFLE